MTTEINEMTELAHEGSSVPLTTTPVVGMPTRDYAPTVIADQERVADGEIRVTILGSGDPFVKRAQASASVLIEVGNEQRDFFFFDMGSGALANFNGLQLPVTATTNVFLSHLHADHVGDMPTLVWSLAKAGRRDPVEVWGPGGERPELGTRAYAQHLQAAHAWDMESLCGHPGQSGARTEVTEVPFDKTSSVYERNGVRISSFPVIHILNGAVGYRLDYSGLSVVFSGDTRPSHTLVDACDGTDLLIHETFPSASVFAAKAGVSPEFAEQVVNGAHTSPAAVGNVFRRAGARMSVMWHLAVDHETVGPAFADMRTQYKGPVTIAQDLTTFTITKDAVVTRQTAIDQCAWPVVGPTGVTGPPMSAPKPPPAWWADALVAD
ncbi:guanitoxin biosynthesis MBL fold metallo-hydrolase GntH [Mycolicibacterium pyrenivorans]|uniref:guanitoxin biosynthesis MBL fold metallo-hydrolase GntH n=1 Tax=Mycolicibacterium pyrenivorans TaxID=187102 RepID=UPI0021F2547B|nr:guanitoxin biosynthesis MBL fold metallo-hydrolase GntH [Mycolicibacterium pyrenivorans]MCV7152162.1 MBL fold metallo-hydrolase [Mycolicibacterium pyrenivorans]